MQRWYKYILQVTLGLCSCMPIVAMHIPVLTIQLERELIIALEKNNLQHIKNLLDNGIISIDSKNYNGDTPLHLAAKYNRTKVITLLLDRGAKIDSKNYYGNTLLHYAVYRQNLEVIQLLLDRGANVEIKNQHNWTPLNEAAFDGNVKIITLLLDRGGNIESHAGDGRTPLHNAACHGKVEALALLLDKGANIESKDCNRDTFISYILRGNNVQQQVDLLVKNKPYYINMSQRPSTLLGTVIMYMLKKSKERNNQHRYDYIYTAQQVATLLHDERARELLNTLRIASTLKDQEQSAKRYLKQYIERQDANAASELKAIPLRKEGLREITGHIHSLKDVIHLR